MPTSASGRKAPTIQTSPWATIIPVRSVRVSGIAIESTIAGATRRARTRSDCVFGHRHAAARRQVARLAPSDTNTAVRTLVESIVSFNAMKAAAIKTLRNGSPSMDARRMSWNPRNVSEIVKRMPSAAAHAPVRIMTFASASESKRWCARYWPPPNDRIAPTASPPTRFSHMTVRIAPFAFPGSPRGEARRRRAGQQFAAGRSDR